MKRIFGLIVSVLICFSLVLPASAAGNNTCVISGEMQYISYNDALYTQIDGTYLYLTSDDYKDLDYEFESEEFEEQIDYLTISAYDYIIEAYVEYGSVSENIYYVRSDKKEWMANFLNGNDASYVITCNTLAYVDRYLDIDKVSSWLLPENSVTISNKDVRFYNSHPVYITDSTKNIRLLVGDVYENGTNYYFVRYSDYTSESLYKDGTIAELGKAYLLSDAEYKEALAETYSENAEEQVDEELMQQEEVIENVLNGFTEVSLVVVIGLLLVVIPLVAIVLALIFILAKGAKAPYKPWLIAIIATALVVLLCSVPIIIMLFF